MNVKKISLLILSSITVLGIIGYSGYLIYDIVDKKDDENLHIDLNNGNSKDLSFSLTNLYPGKAENKLITVSSNKVNSNLELSFTFKNENNNSLLDYLDLKIYEKETYYQGKLKDITKVNLKFDKKIELNFTYLIPLEVSNEAQGASLDSTIHFKLVA